MSLISKFETVREDPRVVWLRLLQWQFQIRGHQGDAVMAEDWDNLLILDACRYDLFEQVYSPSQNLESRTSLGTNTAEFLERNFLGNHFPDTVYITANPQVRAHSADDCFHDCIHLWDTDWDEEYQTVLPETVASAAVKTQQEYPNKRLIVHFIQPHYPFIGETGSQVPHRTLSNTGLISGAESEISIWDRLARGDIDSELVKQAYQENLELTIPHVKNLIEDLIGKSIVTSDHGNAFGRLGIYGHPRECYIRELTQVPWLVCDTGERKQVTTEPSTTPANTDGDIDQRLRDLGYLD